MFISSRTPFFKKLILTALLAVATPAHTAFGQDEPKWFGWKIEGRSIQVKAGTKGILAVGALALLVIFRADIKKVAAKLYF